MHYLAFATSPANTHLPLPCLPATTALQARRTCAATPLGVDVRDIRAVCALQQPSGSNTTLPQCLYSCWWFYYSFAPLLPHFPAHLAAGRSTLAHLPTPFFLTVPQRRNLCLMYITTPIQNAAWLATFALPEQADLQVGAHTTDCWPLRVCWPAFPCRLPMIRLPTLTLIMCSV